MNCMADAPQFGLRRFGQALPSRRRGHVSWAALPDCTGTASDSRSLYEDLYDLVRFIPSLNLPCGIPSATDANNASGLPQLYHRRSNAAGDSQESFGDKMLQPTPPPSSHPTRRARPMLLPARSPPVFRWSECFPISFLVTKRQRLKAEGRKARKERIKADRQGGGVGANVPLEVTMFMSSWLATMQRRKTIDVPTTNALLLSLQQMGEALSALERILTTPIPWSYNAHIWAVSHGAARIVLPS